MLDNYNGSSIIFGATNHQHLLDTAIWRRFDDVIYYELPNEDSRSKMFMKFLKPMKREKDINFKELAKRSENLSPADIKMIAESAMKLSIINNKPALTKEALLLSVNRFIKREKLHIR
jgi:SpoVK/Ycf46/Vps4 family AAA+-type ATPase